ncbi:MAG: hypothetical protein ACKVWV_17355 [Planctomycetota bacterium]
MRSLLFVLLALLVPPQDPGAKDPAQSDDAPDRPARIDKQKLWDDMQGPWKLAELRLPADNGALRSDAGFCIVSGDYLSIELHVGWVGESRNLIGRTFQSGMHHFEIDDTGRIQTSTLIGSFITKDGALDFERPGTARNYHAAVASNRLSLTRDDGQVLVFNRVFSTEPRRDIFGRERKSRPAKGSTNPSDD